MRKEKVVYYTDELNDDFAGTNIITKPLKEDYRYIHKGLIWNLFAIIFYWIIAFPLVCIVQKVWTHQKIINKKVIKKASKKKGYYLFLNHTQLFSYAVTPALVSAPHKAYITAHPDCVSIPGIRTIVEWAGALPLSSTFKGMKNMYRAMDYRLKHKNTISVFPEAHIWPYYNKIRPFSDASFAYAIKFDVPVFAVTSCYQKRKYFSRPKMLTFVDGPFYPDPNLSPTEARKKLRDQVYNVMVERVTKYSTYEYIKYVKKEKAE
jgi:1-acyl-sn-glycerol-3-phosphate acyltransferase